MVYRNSAKRVYEEGQRKMAKTKNPIAKDLRTPKYRKRVTRDKTKYDRKRNGWTILILKKEGKNE